MIYLFGNCQMEFLGQAMAGLGLENTFRAMATPLGPLSSGGRIPDELADWATRFDLDSYLHGRSLINQFQAITPDDPAPSLFILNLFHENEPLFAHESGYLFFVDPAAWIAQPEFAAWMEAEFQQVKLPPMDYLNRWARLAEALRRTYPTVPMLLATQLSHFPGFGPAPYSYLSCWEDCWEEGRGFIGALARELGNCQVLDADRIFASVWNGSARDMDDHCPFLKITIDGDGSRPNAMLRRDLEHIGSLWPAMAAKVAEFVRTGGGLISWDALEEIPEQWSRPHVPRKLSVDRLRELLCSGANYQGARAVNAFFQDLGTDHTPLLAEAAEQMVVCHGTLHMVHRYSMLHPGTGLTAWCMAQREKAEAYAANGPEYRRRYLERLREIMDSVAMQSVAVNLGSSCQTIATRWT